MFCLVFVPVASLELGVQVGPDLDLRDPVFKELCSSSCCLLLIQNRIEVLPLSVRITQSRFPLVHPYYIILTARLVANHKEIEPSELRVSSVHLFI